MDYSGHTDKDATKVEKFLGQYRTNSCNISRAYVLWKGTSYYLKKNITRFRLILAFVDATCSLLVDVGTDKFFDCII